MESSEPSLIEKEITETLIEKNLQLRNEIASLKVKIENIKESGKKWTSSISCRGIPPNAVLAGKDLNHGLIYVGRAQRRGNILPAEIFPNEHKAYVTLDEAKHHHDEYEYLCGKNYQWIKSSGGKVPPNAVVGGETVSGEILYIGRTQDSRAGLRCGQVLPSSGNLYYSFDGKQYTSQTYEILIELPTNDAACSSAN